MSWSASALHLRRSATDSVLKRLSEVLIHRQIRAGAPWSTIDGVGRHSAHRAAAPAYDDPAPPRRALLLLAVGLTATLVAWAVLVHAAIGFGQDARSGAQAAWGLLAVSTLGAAGCLFATFLIGGRIRSLLRGTSEPPRPRGPGAHRCRGSWCTGPGW